ncbi:hypothetical protein BDV12DRAFT_207278 [Aspergillus spectabilis]
MHSSIWIYSLSACATALAAIIPSVSRGLAEGSFATPAVSVKPKFRYWLPDASTDAGGFSDDIAQLAKRGAGGTELLNYFGLPTSVTPSNWDIYGYGAPGYAKIAKVALEAHRDVGILFDYAHSANGCVPAKKGNPGLSWQLNYYSTIHNGSFSGTVPGWGKGQFAGAVVFAVTNVGTNPPDFHGAFGWGRSYPAYTISNGTLADVTDLIDSKGFIEISPKTIPNAQYYVVQAYYARPYFQNGSVAVDHFSAVGAEVITDFMEDYVLLDGVQELFRQVGKNLWEDSVEISGDTCWTPGLLDKFQAKYGVILSIPYLPLIVARNGYTTRSPSNIYILDTEDQGEGILADFRNLLSSLSKEYTDFIQQWSHDVLGMDFSAQMGYNMPVDMLQTMTDIDLPEAETLSFSNQIDSYLQVAGPADLAGKQIVSVELGADWHQAYFQSWEMLLFDAKHAFAGGINQVVIHGATYSHNFTNTTWPGYTTHGYDYPGQHSRHQPAWDVGYSEALGYLARVQWVLQSGVAKVDLIFWDKQSAQDAYPQPLYWYDDLTEAGNTHEYLSPANFVLDKAVVRNKLFAPDAQAAKALIIRGNDTLTPEGVQYLATYAAAGLPIVFSGDLPSKYASGNAALVSKAKATLQGLLDYSNVCQVPVHELAASLKAIGITPRVQVQSNGRCEIYVWIYNDAGDDSTGTLTFATSGTPYYLNAWTGKEESIIEYTTSRSSDPQRYPLPSGDTRPGLHVTASSQAVLGYNVQFSGSLIHAKIAFSTSPSSISTSSLSIPQTFNTPTVQPAYSLSNWNLTIEHWDAQKNNITIPNIGPSLKSWKNLNHPDISGTGFYRTTFTWTPKSGDGAYLVLPPVSDGIVGTLNGETLPALDITNPTVDIKSYLKIGTNVLELKVSSTLKNSLRAIWADLRTAGGGVATSWDAISKLGFGLQDYGLIGEVRIVPYALRLVL